MLGLGLVAGLSVGVYEFLKGELPPVGLGIVLLLMMVALLTGISIILRATSRQMRQHLSQTHTDIVAPEPAEPVSAFTLLRNKSR